MSPSKQLAARLLPFLGSRGYASAARYAARAGEEVIAVNNAHKAASTVMEVGGTQHVGRQHRACCWQEPRRSRALVGALVTYKLALIAQCL